MNRSRLLMIGALALAAGLLVSYSVYNRLRASAGSNNGPGVEVVVAANDIPIGTKLAERDVRLVRYPQSNLPSGVFTKRAQVFGRGVVLPDQRRRIHPAEQAGGGKRRGGVAGDDPAGNARGFGARQ